MLNIRRELVHDLPADGVVDRGRIGFETLADEAESRDDRETKNPHGDDHFYQRESLPSRLRALASCYIGMGRRIGHWERFDFDAAANLLRYPSSIENLRSIKKNVFHPTMSPH